MKNMRKFRLIITVVVALVILVGLGSSSAVVVNSKLDTKAYNNGNLLRLHVIANSNSPADQKLKRIVRDEIIAQTKNLFKGVKSGKKARKLVKKNLSYIERVAESKLNKLGSDYQIKVKLGNFHFPRRTYGDLTLPTGNYDALRVVIGQGEGENWWCVLFPPFCYIDSVNKQERQQSLDKLDKTEVDIKIESKFVEYLDKNPKLAQKIAQKKEKLKNLLMMSITDFNNLIDNRFSSR